MGGGIYACAYVNISSSIYIFLFLRNTLLLKLKKRRILFADGTVKPRKRFTTCKICCKPGEKRCRQTLG